MLALLQEDGRIANVELAEKVGPVADRDQRAAEAADPRGLHHRLPRHARSGEARARLAGLRRGDYLDKTTPDVFERFAAAVKRAPEVLECHMVAGGFDYLVKTRVADMNAYRRFLGEVLLALPGVRETRTYAVMEEVKATASLHFA
jgi:Lrp/AsnC family leucine-responsive transcriptional regulator